MDPVHEQSEDQRFEGTKMLLNVSLLTEAQTLPM